MGSFLTPILFNIFIKSTKAVIMSKTHNFIDTNKLFRGNKVKVQCYIVAGESGHNKRATTCQMRFNAHKYKSIHLGSPNFRMDY